MKQTSPERLRGGETHAARARENAGRTTVKRKQGREALRDWKAEPSLPAAPPTVPVADGRMLRPAGATNGDRGTAPFSWAGPVRGSVCLHLKSVFTGRLVVVEPFLLSHGCADFKDEDLGVARQL